MSGIRGGLAVAVGLAALAWCAQLSKAQTVRGDGEAVFARCAGCHSLQPGVNRLGPSLSNIVGRKAASSPNFVYSPALKAADLKWDARTLDRFLTKPSAAVPGTRMAFTGMSNPEDRATLITYLREQ